MARVVEAVLEAEIARAGHINAAMTLDNVLEMDHLSRQRADEAMAAINR